jgi:hypothetical protein
VTAAGVRLPPLGAPDLYWLPPNPIRVLTGVRMDVCAFVGVAPRGPSRVPVFDVEWAPRPCAEGATGSRSVPIAVESWDEYARHYGRFEGPGLLPYAVASFFENGGVRAYIVRVVHDYRKPDGTRDDDANDAGVSAGIMPGLRASAAGGDFEISFRARDEGTWGTSLSAALSFTTRPLSVAAAAFTTTGLVFERGTEIDVGAVLRLDHGAGVRTLTRIARVWEEWHPDEMVVERHASFDTPVALPVLGAELVEGSIAIDDGDGRREQFDRVGLSSVHKRWLARVLVEESELLYPGENRSVPPSDPRGTWLSRDLVLDVTLPTYTTAAFTPVTNRYADIVPDDFFDAGWTPSGECPGDGVHCLTQLSDLSLVVAPDLYSPKPIAPIESVLDSGGAGADFCECVTTPPQKQAPPAEDVDGLRLDPSADFDAIVALQRRLLDLADVLESFVVLLDVPPGLSQRRMLAWRDKLHSMYGAAYHSWLLVSRPDDQRDRAIAVNPSAIAAGIIARRELARGVQYGPANEIVDGVFDVTDHLSPVRQGELHQNAINVFMRERDGARLTAARTLSPDPNYRQLSVRRLMTMLRRVLYREMQWAVFEPNDARLRGDIRNQLDAYLRQLYAADAFAGARAEDAFFVRCDDELNPQTVADQGRLYAYVGVAPAEPLEFLVLQIARDGDGTLRVQG